MARKSKDQLHKDKMAALYAEAQRVWDAGKCPQCGAGLHLNSAILGWVQCDRSGSAHFRRDKTGPACQFQTFIKWG